jgi:5-methyltetrahydrofolate--homocysteine methyltransferase
MLMNKSFRLVTLLYPPAELADCIDWTPFFQTWELTGRFPAILDDAKVGRIVRAYADAIRE